MGFLDNLPFGNNPLQFISELPFKLFGGEEPDWLKDVQNVTWNVASLAAPFVGGPAGAGLSTATKGAGLIGGLNPDNFSSGGGAGGDGLPDVGSFLPSAQQDAPELEEDPEHKRLREQQEQRQQLEALVRQVTSAL